MSILISSKQYIQDNGHKFKKILNNFNTLSLFLNLEKYK